MPIVKKLCEYCPMLSLGMKLSSDIQPGSDVLTSMKLKKQQVLESDLLSEHFLIVQRGSLKVEYLCEDGRAEVAAFLFPGEAVVAAYSEEPAILTALEDTVLCEFDLAKLREDNPRAASVTKVLIRKFGLQASLDQKRLIEARAGGVTRRLLWLLQDIGNRTARNPVRLTMSRDDIAHYIDTSTETVSRALSSLVRAGAIIRDTPRNIRLTQA